LKHQGSQSAVRDSAGGKAMTYASITRDDRGRRDYKMGRVRH